MRTELGNLLRKIKASFLAEYAEKEPPIIPVELFGRQEQSETLQPILYSAELNYLNAHWGDWDPRAVTKSHRPLLGRLIVRVKNYLLHCIFDNLLRSYFEREREFNMNLVRHLNSSARYIDGRNKDLFWQLINKVDQESAHLAERCDYLYFNCLGDTKISAVELKKEIKSLRETVEALQSSVEHLKKHG